MKVLQKIKTCEKFINCGCCMDIVHTDLIFSNTATCMYLHIKMGRITNHGEILIIAVGSRDFNSLPERKDVLPVKKSCRYRLLEFSLMVGLGTICLLDKKDSRGQLLCTKHSQLVYRAHFS